MSDVLAEHELFTLETVWSSVRLNDGRDAGGDEMLDRQSEMVDRFEIIKGWSRPELIGAIHTVASIRVTAATALEEALDPREADEELNGRLKRPYPDLLALHSFWYDATFDVEDEIVKILKKRLLAEAYANLDHYVADAESEPEARKRWPAYEPAGGEDLSPEELSGFVEKQKLAARDKAARGVADKILRGLFDDVQYPASIEPIDVDDLKEQMQRRRLAARGVVGLVGVGRA